MRQTLFTATIALAATLASASPIVVDSGASKRGFNDGQNGYNSGFTNSGSVADLIGYTPDGQPAGHDEYDGDFYGQNGYYKRDYSGGQNGYNSGFTNSGSVADLIGYTPNGQPAHDEYNGNGDYYYGGYTPFYPN
ncbi:hypothetical protein C8Q75DRAFT_808279 [Abortiporus biennis]|nr:hypothetical protein C8Q75DRAFT_808279 [Abortiporus biennis]